MSLDLHFSMSIYNFFLHFSLYDNKLCVLQMQCIGGFMKTATIPSLRVEPELRHAVEDVLRNNETLSSFVEQSLRAHIRLRQLQDEFIARGLASRDEARKTGEYYDADNVLSELDTLLSRAEGK
jgi:predicted transcriptional regulator